MKSGVDQDGAAERRDRRRRAETEPKMPPWALII
jgi:hypothetical protein